MMRTLSLPSRLARTSCSVLALATVLVVGATPATAQSFLGVGTPTNGAATTITTGSGTTNITVTTSQTVINWVPTDNAIANNTGIAFQNSGTTATFSGTGNYAVLNRIIPDDTTRMISMDGNILTSPPLGFPGASTGSIYFYTPGGFVIGPNAVINVGSLVLSASDITVTGGSFINGPDNTVIFGQAPRPGAAIVTNALSQITANGTDAYVAMVAPRVQHGGTINVSGSAALVGAEAATINFSPDGLFDIQVTSGTNNLDALTNSGTITGPASDGTATDIHRAYLVAVPKNDALTMLLTAGSNLGFNVAGAANVVGNTVVLSAGYDVLDGAIRTTRSAGGGTGLSDLTVYDTDFTSQVNAAATDLGLFVAYTPTASMAAGLTLRAANAQFNAFNGGIHQVVGSVTLDTTNLGTGAGATGGITYAVASLGGTINIGGDLSLISSGTGTAGVTGTGGSADVIADQGGSMTIGGMLRMNADGTGGSGATGRGGSVDIVVGANSSLSAGRLNETADGTGGNDAGSGAGNGIGGDARLLATGTEASIAIANVVTTGNQNQRDFVSVEGFGGKTNGGGSGIGGTGTGGTLLIRGDTGGSIMLPNIPVSTGVRILARGYGGDAAANGTTGGLGAAGTLNLQLDNATLTAGPVILSSAGLGGIAAGPGNITGGNGIGGTRAISAVNGSTLSIGLPGGIAGGGGGGGSGTGAGGNASGGTASLLVDASTVNFTSRSVIIAQNAGGDGAIGGNASGGNATVTVRNGGIINVADDPLAIDDLLIGSFAYGGIGAGAQGGNATAGNVSLLLQGGTINLTGGMRVGAEARGGATLAGGGNSGDGNGGNVTVTATGANSMIAGSGAANFSADAFGGSSGSGIGGNGNAGSVTISAEGGTGLTIQNSLTVSASATGGNGATGGGAAAGNVIVRALTGGDLNLLGATSNFSANATGGNALGGGFGDGGDAYGWNIDIHADGVGSTLTIGGAATATANATSGSSESGDGGNADAGAIDLYAQNSGSLSFDSDLTALANAEGGTGPSGGGNAHGGEVSIYSLATLQVDGYLTARAEANGGDNLSADYSGWVAGDAYGGDVDVYANGANSTLTVANAVILSTNASGGAGANSGDGGGYGEGGNTHLYARADGTIDLQSSLTVSATGYGGDFGGLGTTGGDGKGGQIAIQADGANASVTVGGAELDASGYAVDGGGGSGSGGLVVVEAFGAPTASLVFLGNLAMYAGGGGGDGYYGLGGVGQGGDVRLTSTDGTVITVGGNAWLNTSASGGDTYNSVGAGGNAVGGTTRIETFGTGGAGGTIAILGNADVAADGYGGGANGSPSGQGGDGTGGSAHILTTLGTITIGQDGPGGSATVSADGYGGFAAGGVGGDGFGGDFAVIEAIGGDVIIYGAALVSASGTGGYGLITGGDGFGSGEYDELNEIWTGGAHIYARNGDIVIGGGATVKAVGTGGFGLNEGGHGGGGFGGYATIHAANSDLGSSSISIVGGESEGSGSAEVNVSGTGGNGGNNANGSAGGDGGNGGNGRGGTGIITAAAGNGTVTIGQAFGYALGTGGYGGDGGSGGECFACDGGNGGNGGNGRGGYITIGTVSGSAQSTGINNGFGDYGSITIDSSAVGGFGGDGNFGATHGDGGNGGNATGGSAYLLVRGSRVDVDTANLYANATGGNAGFGDGETSITGIGGNATVGGDGGIAVLVTDRYLISAHRGTLNAGSITGTAIATGGIGIPNGNSQNLGGSGVVFRNADGNIGSLDFLVQTGMNASNSGVDSISIIDGDVIVDYEFAFNTSGNMSLFANNGDMHTGILTLSAGNFVFDPTTLTDRGTYFADSATITTGNNFVTSADLVIGSSLVIDAPGLINAHNFGIDGDLDLIAQGGGITANDLNVTGAASLDAFGAINLNVVEAGFFRGDAGGTFTSSDITSDSDIRIDAGDDVTLGDLLAGTSSIGSSKAVRIDTDGSVLVGNILAAGGIDVTADGSVTGGNVTTGDVLITEAGGAIVYQNISAGLVTPQIPSEPFSVVLDSNTSINVGTVDTTQGIGFITLGTLTTGDLTTNSDILGLVHGNINIGDIDAGGRVQLADSAMFTNAGGAIGNQGDDEIDVESIFAAALVPTGGSITVGDVLAGSLQVAAGTFIDVGSIDAGSGAVALLAGGFIGGDIVEAGSIYAESGDYIFLGNLTAPGDIELVAVGDISIGNATAGESIDLDAGGYVDGGNMTAGDSVYVEAGDYVDLGDISAGIDPHSSDEDAEYNVGILAATTILTGDIEAFNSIGLGAAGNIYTGSIDAGDIFLALGGGDMSFGTINSVGTTYLANASMIELGGDPTGEDFDPLLILAATPVASGASITLRGAATAGLFQASAGTSFSSGNITSDTNIQIDSATNMTVRDLIAGLSIDDQSDKAIRLNSGGSIVMGNATAKGGIDFDADGSVTGENLTSGVFVGGSAVGAIILEALSGGLVDPQGLDDGGFSVGLSSGTSINVGSVEGLQSVGFASFGALTTGNIDAGGDVLAMAGGNMDLGTIHADGRVYLAGYSMFLAAGGDVDGDDFESELVFNATPVTSGGSILTGPITAASVQAAAGTTFTSGEINADGRVEISSGGAMQLQDVTVGTSLRLTSGATIDGGDLTAGTLVRVSAAGAVDVGDITIDGGIVVTDGFQILDVGPGSPVEVFGASIVTGDISTDGYVGLYTPGDLSVGTIDAGHDVIALVGDDAAFAAIATPERFFLGGYQMFALVTGGEGFNPEAVFDAEPKGSTGGSATFAGSSSANTFEAYVGDDTTLASLNTNDFALIDTGGMFTLSGALNGDSRVISNDIDIGATAAINGELHLISRNASQTLIGDGLDGLGQGYRLSDAEADRINAAFTIAADTSYGAAAKMIIGDLSIIANGDSESELEFGFGTINRDSDDPSVGSIKIVGDVTFSGLGQFDGVDFDTNLFELDAATGSITLYGQGTTLGGELGLYAPRVWVASGAILAKLEANPTYSGYITELNAPAAVQRPEGVLRAGSIDIDSGEEQFQSFLVQNTGTAATPAGFVIDGSDLSDDEGSDDPLGSINLVINGQIITAGGTLTGVAARDLLVSEVGSAQFAAGSTVNGCVLVGPCIAAPPPPPPKIDTPARTDVQLSDNSGLGDGLFGNEGDIDDGESGDGGDRSSPISPPMPLFDSRPLVQSGDVDDPVSGAGNPSLYGSPGEDEDEEEQKKKAKAKQGDGK